MDAEQLRSLKPEFDLFLDRYAPHFGHVGNHAQARRFVQGLLLGGDRRSAENIAEAVAGGVVRSLQKFLGQGRWEGDDVLGELQRHVTEVLGDPDAALNVDETGFPKKGTKSVGVKRQYAGCLGRTDNCQVGVYVNYHTAAGHTLIDRRLFLPEDWAEDQPRRKAAGVPESVVFRTKPELALEMVQAAVTRGMPFRWVTADTVYGESPTFVQGVRDLGKWYGVDVACDARVWLTEPKIMPAGTKGDRGRPTTSPKVTTKPVRVDAVASELPATAWHRVVVAEGSQGPRLFDYACVWVWFSEEGLPSSRERLLVRRSIGQDPEVKYHRTNAPEEVPLERVGQARGCHWSVEQGFEAGKGECGMDEYETRGWVGWHHHQALSLLALWFLVLQRLRQKPGEKKRGTAKRSRSAGRAGASAGAA
jgi:SRSO17 transposase